MDSFVPGSSVYKYVLKQRLGAGCFGEVWLSYDNTIGRDVAVKIVRADGPLTVDKFKEAWIGNRFDHNNLVKVHYADVVNVGGENYIIITMDYLENGSILSQLNSCGFLPLPRALMVMRNILFGLDYLHNTGFYHNDIKPSNILVGSAGQAVLSDYGITRAAGETSDVLSYYLHQAPEILSGGNAGILTDIYQCGLTAFRLFCGVGLLDAKWNRDGAVKYNADILSGKLVSVKSFPEFVPSQIRHIILKSTSLNPADRYQSAIDMRRDFEKLSYSGFWDADAKNQLIGRRLNNNNTYVYDENPSKGKTIDFEAKVLYPSGMINRVTQFCKTKVSKSELSKVRQKFIKWVITS